MRSRQKGSFMHKTTTSLEEGLGHGQQSVRGDARVDASFAQASRDQDQEVA